MQFRIIGMTCAACSARVEQAVRSVKGVKRFTVSLLTNSLSVDGTATAEDIIKAVERAGYGAVLEETVSTSTIPEEDTARKLLRRLCISIGFLLLLMYISMGHTMLNLPVPQMFEANPLWLGLLQMILTVVIMIINRHFYINGVRSACHGAPNMDTLVTLGSSAAFGYSVWVLCTQFGDPATAAHALHDLYFESAAMILALITFGKMLEARSKGRTTDALRGLMQLKPRTATVLVDGEERVIPADEMSEGDVFVLHPGDAVPVDGMVLEGSSAVNEAALTGESVPVDKAVGDTVSAATVNLSGYLRCRATRVGEKTTLSQIIHMVEQAAATKAPIAKAADTVAGVFVPIVLGVSLVTLIVWLLCDADVGFAIARAVSVLVISCPCALALATPMAIMVGSGIGARNGVLFKTAAAMEQTGRVRIVALDKTGTITSGHPGVTDVLALDDRLVPIACSLEQHSEHPLGKAVRDYGLQRGIDISDVAEFSAHPGNGVSAVIDGKVAVGGNWEFVSNYVTGNPLSAQATQLAEAGKTPLYFAMDGNLLGLIAVADTIKEDSIEAVQELKKMGMRVVMLTGDNAKTATAIGNQCGVDEVIANVLPQDKEAHIRRLMEQGVTAMVGDGINDAPALTCADVGIAIGAGTDIAMDSANVVLMHSRLTDVPAALRLGRATLKKIRTNLFWAFFYNAIGIPLAAGLFIPLLNWEMNPMFGAAAMCISSFCVMTNTLHLSLFKMHPTEHTNCVDTCEINHCCKEETSMEKTIKVEGMMCPRCEAHVKEALEGIPGVESAVADRLSGTATVTLSTDVEEQVLRAAVEAQGYTTLD